MSWLVALLLLAAPARADAPEHELRTGGAVRATVGQKAAGSLTIVPAAGRSIDRSAPVTVRISAAPAGLKLEKKRLLLADAADPRAEAPRFDLPFVAEKEGSYTLVADVRFWLCAARTCRPVRDRAEIAVEVATK